MGSANVEDSIYDAVGSCRLHWRRRGNGLIYLFLCNNWEKGSGLDIRHRVLLVDPVTSPYRGAALAWPLSPANVPAMHPHSTPLESQAFWRDVIAESKYPKHAGDIVLLARIQYALGQKKASQHLASRSITNRRGIFGAKGPRVADSIFIIAQILADAGEQVLAAKMYGEIIEMSRDMSEMKGHLA